MLLAVHNVLRSVISQDICVYVIIYIGVVAIRIAMNSIIRVVLIVYTNELALIMLAWWPLESPWTL